MDVTCPYTDGFYIKTELNPGGVYYHTHKGDYGGGLTFQNCLWHLWIGGGTSPVKVEDPGVVVRVQPNAYTILVGGDS